MPSECVCFRLKYALMKLGKNLLAKQGVIHPANRLLACGIWAVCLSEVSFPLLLGLTLTIVAVAARVVPNALKRCLYRMRWLLLALMGIFAWSTPGVYLFSAWYAPSVEGLTIGLAQALHLMGVMAGLQIALHGMDQSMLLSACYQLSRPFMWLGVDTSSFAVRLGLTLQYAEQGLVGSTTFSWHTLGAILTRIEEEEVQVKVIEILPFSHLDQWISISLLVCMGGVLGRGAIW